VGCVMKNRRNKEGEEPRHMPIDDYDPTPFKGAIPEHILYYEPAAAPISSPPAGMYIAAIGSDGTIEVYRSRRNANDTHCVGGFYLRDSWNIYHWRIINDQPCEQLEWRYHVLCSDSDFDTAQHAIELSANDPRLRDFITKLDRRPNGRFICPHCDKPYLAMGPFRRHLGYDCGDTAAAGFMRLEEFENRNGASVRAYAQRAEAAKLSPAAAPEKLVVTRSSSGRWRCPLCDLTYARPDLLLHRHLINVHAVDWKATAIELADPGA
jgi:ribosomal protein L37AE/L43A